MDEGRSFEGGCHCRAVRYRIRTAAGGEPPRSVVCHCTDCRLVHSAGMVAWLSVRREALELVKGEPRSYRSSERAVRRFCPSCGTPLTFQHDAQPDWIDIAHATLDDAEALRPAAHIWCRSRLSWVELDDGLPRHERGTDEE